MIMQWFFRRLASAAGRPNLALQRKRAHNQHYSSAAMARAESAGWPIAATFFPVHASRGCPGSSASTKVNFRRQ
jgi:hypothetical protein